jgi:hypothetical protein
VSKWQRATVAAATQHGRRTWWSALLKS